MYRPSKTFSSAFKLLNPVTEKVGTKVVKTYPSDGSVINCSFVTFGGSETVVNGVISIQDTGTIDTWYRPDITSESRLVRLSDGRVFEVIGEPENIEMRNQFLKFRVHSLRGSSNG